jgi:hypothetical protein
MGRSGGAEAGARVRLRADNGLALVSSATAFGRRRCLDEARGGGAVVQCFSAAQAVWRVAAADGVA